LATFRQIKRLGSETIIYGISGTISRFIGIFLVPLYTRVFSPSDYGVIAIITSFTVLLSIFIVLGFDNSSARWFYDSDDLDRRKRIIATWFWNQFFVGLVLCLLIISFANPIAKVLLKSETHENLIRLAAVLIPLGTFSKVTGNLLRYQRRPWAATIFFTATSLGNIGLVVLFVLIWQRGLEGLYWAQIAAGTLSSFMAIFLLFDWINPGRFSKKLLKEMALFGLPLMPAGIASWITTSSDRLILQLFLDSSEVGLYAIAATIASAMALITAAFQMAWGPFAFSIINEKDSVIIFSRVLSIYVFVGTLIGSVISIFAPLIMSILTTDQYLPAVTSIPFLVFSHLIIGSTYILSTGSAIAKKSMPIATSIFIGAGSSIALNFLLIPWIGRDGAAVSSLLAYGLSAIYIYFASKKHFPIPFHLKEVLIYFTFGLLIIGVDNTFIQQIETGANGVRILLLSPFIPLALLTGLIKPIHIKSVLQEYRNRIGKFGN
jgi:O-antigen/teichoic acid export membrane protein